MKNDLHAVTEDISRLYDEIKQKTASLGQLDSITRLYDELQNHLQEISTEEVDLLQTHIKSTLEQMVNISKNLAVIMKRFEKMKEIHHYLSLARGQLDLIQNSFQLIADQIVTMQSPQELTGQLDELLDGVESIKQTAADTERLLNPLGLKDLNI